MKEEYFNIISNTLNISPKQVENTIKLLDEGATIPFISRYRKELTGSLDEVVIAEIQTQINKLLEIDKRRESILKSIEGQGLLTEELKSQIINAATLTELEDIYLPYKPKKRTRGTIAKEKGLEPLAKIVMKQGEMDIYSKAKEFINKEVKDEEEALAGARDIIAEWINENKRARNIVRYLFDKEAIIYSKIVKGKSEEGIKYSDYFNYREPLKKCPSHRMLAIRRGENEGFLKINIETDAEHVENELEPLFVKGYFGTS